MNYKHKTWWESKEIDIDKFIDEYNKPVSIHLTHLTCLHRSLYQVPAINLIVKSFITSNGDKFKSKILPTREKKERNASDLVQCFDQSRNNIIRQLLYIRLIATLSKSFLYS